MSKKDQWVRLPDASARPGGAADPPAPSDLKPFVDRMILSASGWRAVFASDGDEESRSSNVAFEDLILTGLAASVFAAAVVGAGEAAARTIVVGQDSRPTGSALAQAAIRVFLGEGLCVQYLHVTASPQIMAYTRVSDPVDAFFYVSASHNPIGHNGLKMGLADGSVVGGETARKLIQQFRSSARNSEQVARIARLVSAGGTAEESALYRAAREANKRSAEAYTRHTREVIIGPGRSGQAAFDAVVAELKRRRPGIFADFNGSARSVSIDREFLLSAGCRFEAINDRPGEITHEIVPEGPGLTLCVDELARRSKADPALVMGYVPDNDGDRGNIVVVEEPGSARPVEAQDVFALAAVAELSWLSYTDAPSGSQKGKSAIVVNGCTSMRIDRVADTFGVEVHRAEVGEANLVGRARELREQGYTVRFLGEGSNGGNITHPSTVRDPIQTLFAALKFLHAPPLGDRDAPAARWMKAAGLSTANPTISAILDSLPVFTTTSAFGPSAVMQVRSADHGALKTRVEDIWEELWPDLEDVRETLAVSGFSYENYEGTVCRPGRGNRTGAGRGGFKILLGGDDGINRAFLWMRGSGTEPVFRIMVDVEGRQPEIEARLLTLLRALVERADREALGPG